MAIGLAARAARGRSSWFLALVGAAGCSGSVDPSTQPELFPALALEIPALGCFAEVERVGSCARDGDCASMEGERCLLDTDRTLLDRSPVPLTCDVPTGTRRAAERCERSRECETGLCALGGVCVDACATDADCASGWQCRAIEVRLPKPGLAPVMGCARSLVLPDDVQVSVGRDAMRSFGRHSVEVPGVPDPALVLVQGECDADLDIFRVRETGGDRDLFVRGVAGAQNPVLHDGSSLAGLLFPNNPALSPSPAGLMLQVGAGAAQPVRVVVASRPPGRTRFDLNVFYVGGGSAVVEGGMVPGDPRVASMLRGLHRHLALIGFSLGTVREYDVTGALREELSVLEVPRRKVGERYVEGKPERLDELFALSAGVDDPGIDVFLISDMGSYVGIAGGIPALAGIHGSARAGIALALDLLGDLRGAELPLLHEIGHFVGLFHTTESSGTVLDPLADTPVCPLDNDEDEDGELGSVECEGAGADNLMFWSGSGAVLTAQQLSIMASSVVLR